jgi:anti-sigma B factor antagonist
VSKPSTPENPLGIESQQVNNALVVRFHNAKILNERSLNEMGNRLMACVEAAPQPPRLAICFDGVNFLSSAALGKLIMVHRKVKERGGELKLCNLSPPTLEVFRVAHLDDYFHIHPDLNSALGGFS